MHYGPQDLRPLIRQRHEEALREVRMRHLKDRYFLGIPANDQLTPALYAAHTT
jgi:hypothetical protein